jgi:hypothetical protein
MIQVGKKIALQLALAMRADFRCGCYGRPLCDIMIPSNALKTHSARFLHFLFTVQEAILFGHFLRVF